MKKILTNLAPIFLLVGGLFFACQKTDFNNLTVAEHESEWAAPLFHTSIGIEDLLEKTLVDTAAKLLIGADGSLTFYYQGDVAEKNATELFNFFKDPIPFLIQAPNTEVFVPLKAPSGLHIRKVLLKAGHVKGLAANFGSDTVFVIAHIDQLTKNGVPFSISYKVPPGGAFVTPDSSDLNGFLIESSNDTIRAWYEASFADGSPTQLLGAGMLAAELQFSYVEGFWESTSYPLQADTIPIDIYKFVAGDGKIQFDNPRVTASILSSFGFPTRALIHKLRMVLKDGTFVPFTGSAIDNGIDAVYPSLSEVGQTKVTEFYFDKNNSNIKEIFNSQPVALEYDISGISNPDNDPNFIGFMTDSSFVRLRMRVELPLRASAKDFVIQDTLDLNFGSYGSGGSISTDQIVEAEFKLVTENRMPIALETQIIFLDRNLQPIDSLFSDGPKVLLEAAPVDANGFVTGKSTPPPIIFKMDAARFDRVRRAEKAVMRSRFNTSGGGLVPVTAQANQKTDIRMGLKVKLK